MSKISITVCPYCKTYRFDSELNGRCRFCNTSLVEKQVEVDDSSEEEKAAAEKYLSDRRGRMVARGSDESNPTAQQAIQRPIG